MAQYTLREFIFAHLLAKPIDKRGLLKAFYKAKERGLILLGDSTTLSIEVDKLRAFEIIVDDCKGRLMLDTSRMDIEQVCRLLRRGRELIKLLE